MKAHPTARRRLLASLLLATGLVTAAAAADVSAPAASSDASVALQGPSDCRFMPPEGWGKYTVRWEGACAQGRATGSGVLRAYGKNEPTLFFYGKLEAGEPRIGVIEMPGSFIAGEFEHGVALPTDDRNVFLKAFDEAEKAAKQAAARFKSRGNEASARFYGNKAVKLSEQMD